MVDKIFEKITYEDNAGSAKGVYEYFNFGSAGTYAPYNGGYGANLTVDRKTRKEKVPLIGFRYPLKIEQDKTPANDDDDETELTLRIPQTRVDQYGILFSIVFLTKTWSALKSITITTYSNGVFQDHQIRNIGSIKISKNTYQYYLANIASGDAGRAEVRVLLIFTSSKLKDGRMGIKAYEGFSFNGFPSSDYTNANVTTRFTYPHQKEFDKHKFQDTMVGDVLLAGVKQIDGAITPDDTLKLTIDNLPNVMNVFLSYIAPSNALSSNNGWCNAKNQHNTQGYPYPFFPRHGTGPLAITLLTHNFDSDQTIPARITFKYRLNMRRESLSDETKIIGDVK